LLTILLQDTPNLESSGPLAIDCSQNSSSFAKGFPGGTSSAFSYEFDSVPGIVWSLLLLFPVLIVHSAFIAELLAYQGLCAGRWLLGGHFG
jgi:hypothetical protein